MLYIRVKTKFTRKNLFIIVSAICALSIKSWDPRLLLQVFDDDTSNNYFLFHVEIRRCEHLCRTFWDMDENKFMYIADNHHQLILIYCDPLALIRFWHVCRRYPLFSSKTSASSQLFSAWMLYSSRERQERP